MTIFSSEFISLGIMKYDKDWIKHVEQVISDGLKNGAIEHRQFHATLWS
jgi:hypothetical protein